MYFVAGVDYVPVSINLNFSEAMWYHNIELITIEDTMFEGNEAICLRIISLIEPCPNSVVIGEDTRVLVLDDDSKIAIHISLILYGYRYVCLIWYSSSIHITLQY